MEPKLQYSVSYTLGTICRLNTSTECEQPNDGAECGAEVVANHGAMGRCEAPSAKAASGEVALIMAYRAVHGAPR